MVYPLVLVIFIVINNNTMIYSNTPNPPSKFTATMWGKTVTIELDHSDIDLNELMDIFKGLTIASGFEMTSWNNVIKDTASEIYNEEHEIVKEALDTSDDACNECDDNDFFGSWGSIEEESVNERMDVIGQNGNEGTHYDEDVNVWDNETNDILLNINDSITLIKDRMEDIDMRMDNIDEQIGILNADVANIELDIAFPPPNEHILKAKDLYDRAVKAHNMDRGFYKDVVDMETGEVKNDMEVSYDEDGGFAVKMNKSKVTKGKIKDLKK